MGLEFVANGHGLTIAWTLVWGQVTEARVRAENRREETAAGLLCPAIQTA